MTKPNLPSREIEHLWAYHSERHEDEFLHPGEFAEYRNHLGGHLLLSKSFSARYGELSYAEKCGRYLGQNLPARSLHEQAHDRNPGFRRFIEGRGRPFGARRDIGKVELDARRELYRRSVGRIWDPDRFAQEAAS